MEPKLIGLNLHPSSSRTSVQKILSALLLSFGSDSFQFLPAAVKLRNIFSGSSELRIKHLPMLAVLGLKIRVGKTALRGGRQFPPQPGSCLRSFLVPAVHVKTLQSLRVSAFRKLTRWG